MSDLTGKFAALETQLEAADAAMQVDLNALREQMEFLNAQIDTLNLNGAANTRAILAALAANSPCSPCPTPSLVVPPVDDTVTPINAERCKRSQAFVQALLQMATSADVISAFSVPFSPQLILDAVDQVITSLGNGDPTPVMTWAEASNFVNQAITYAMGNFLVGDTLVGFISSLAFDIRDATYSAGSAEEAKAAYEGVIDSSSVPTYAKGLLKALAWNELYSFYFDPASNVNVTGYSGTVCEEIVPGACFRRASELVDVGGGLRETILMSHAYDDWTVSWPDAPLGEWVSLFANIAPGTHIDELPFTLGAEYENTTLGKFWFSREGAAYELEFCPPEV